MMKRILTALAVLIAALTGAQAQNATRVIPLQNGTAVGASNPLYIQGTLSASLSGFAPGASYASLTATGSSARAALPTGVTAVVFNTGTTAVSCALGNSSVNAVANENIIQASSWLAFTIGSNVDIACIDQGAADTTSNVVVISGGSGLPTGSGGGGGGGGGNVTIVGPLGQALAAASVPVVLTAAQITTLTPPTNTGYATSANQVTEYSYLSTIAAAVVSPIPTQAPTVSIGGVGIIDSAGTNVATVKAASTPATATDKSIVVQINAAEQPAIPVTSSPTSADPCQVQTAIILPFSIPTGTTTNILTGTSAKKIYVCYWYTQTGIANNYAIIEGTTGATCGTSTKALVGGVTAATGLINAANSGQAMGNGGYSVMQTTVSNNDICVITSAAGPLAGVMKYVIQ